MVTSGKFEDAMCKCAKVKKRRDKNEECQESKNKETHVKFKDENFGDEIVEENLKENRRITHSMTGI